MLRAIPRRGFLAPVLVLALVGAAMAEEPAPARDSAQALLDKASEVKLSAENLGDLNEVVKLCQDAITAGLDDANKKFAEELLASTLAQRAEMACLELFERPVSPSRARKLLQAALEDLQTTLQLDADQPESQYLLGRLYAHLGENEKALATINEAVRLAADNPSAKSKALLIRARVQASAEARQADYDEAFKLTPKDPDVLRFRGMNYVTEGQLELALTDLKAALEIEPNDADTHEGLGLALAIGEKYDEALASFNKAIELNPQSGTAWTHRARTKATQGDLPGALVDVEKAIKLQPGSVAARMLHANLLGTTGKLEQALAELTVLRKAMPEAPELLVQIGSIYQAMKQPGRAIATYDQLLLIEPLNAAALRGRGDAYLAQGKQSEAIADYETALKQEPKHSGVLNNLAWVLATSTDAELRNGKRAVELALTACEVTEYKQSHILSTLAAGYAEQGDFETAMNWSKKAIELGDEPMKGQLAKELKSYEQKQPWREVLPELEAEQPMQAEAPRPKRS